MPTLSLYLSAQHVAILENGAPLTATRIRDLAIRGRLSEAAEAALDPFIAHEQALAACRAALVRAAASLPNPQAALVHETGTALPPPASPPV